MALADVKALTFDVFGTVVDLRGSIIREGKAISESKGLNINWEDLFDRWRPAYGKRVEQVSSGELPWANLDVLHLEALEEVLAELGITEFTEHDKHVLNMGWHRLTPWPDSIPGLTRLRKLYILATLSNGHFALLTNMAKHSDIPWDCILAPDILGNHYKPEPEVYHGAARLLDLNIGEVMMVAAHKPDLKAAQDQGMMTAFVPKPLEYGPGVEIDTTGEPWLDFMATDLEDMASQLE